MTPVEQIKSRLSTADVVSSYVKLIRAGSNFKAVCPFHSEKSPSFFVSPARDSWHCFGCQKGGDQFQFVMDIEGVDFREALQILAGRAGVELRHENPRERDERARLFSLMELAAKYYQAGLQRFPAVQEYLTARGVVPGTIKKFRVGYAPPETSGWRVFADYALTKGYTAVELERAGLVVTKADDSSPRARYYDRFRNRIMFPIADANGRAVGFGGRVFLADGAVSSSDKEVAKYINSPQTALYDKSRILYAFDKAKISIHKENACVVVEGYMDAIMAHQAGTENVVAVSGTALTPQQLTSMRRLCDKLITAFDMDMAGESATRRSLDAALAIGFDVKAITIPSGKDPADLVKSDPAGWRTATGNAVDVVAYFLDKALLRYDSNTLEGKRGITRSVLSLVTRIPQEVEKAHWVSMIASRLGVREESVWEDLKKIKHTVSSGARSERDTRFIPAKTTERTRTQRLQERVLGLLYRYNLPVSPDVSEELFSVAMHKSLFTALPQGVTAVKDKDLQAFASRLMFEAELHVSEEQAPEELYVCLTQLRREYAKEQLERITAGIRNAEQAGNTQQVSALADEFRAVSQQLGSI